MLQEIIAVVREAGTIFSNARNIENDTTEKTSAADLVTKYDVATQAFLKEHLLSLMPDADFFGEEGEHQRLTKDWTFIVDPIDGTTNFIRSMNYSNISVALAYRGEVRYAVVYNPFIDELYAAEKGLGATLNGNPIHVSDRDTGHCIFLCGSSVYNRSYTSRNFAILEYLYDHCLDYRRFGAAALDLCALAAGRAEMFFECYLSPWDYAAGSLILTEAGGRITRLDGSPLDPLAPGSLWATNELCHEMYRQLPQ